MALRISDAIKAVDRYWFDRGSPVAFGIFRLSTGAIVFLNLLLLAFDWDAWFSEAGYVPTSLAHRWLGPDPQIGFGISIPRLGLISNVTDPRFGIAFFVLVLIAALFTTLGLWTRISSVVLAAGLVSLHHRNPIILQGGDTIMRISALYLAVGPSGASCSLDRLIALMKGRAPLDPPLVSLWAQRLVSYNLALVYFTTVWIKHFGSLWRDGTATWYTARLAEFHRFPVPAFFNDPPMIYVTTYATMGIEFALATLVFFRPARKYILLAGLMLHAFIEYSMNVPFFAFAICSMYICFFDGEEVAAWAQRVGRRLRRLHATLHLPAGRRLTPQGVALLDAVDPLKLITYLPGDADEWQAHDADGRSSDPAKIASQRSIGAWPIAWIPGLWSKTLSHALENVVQQPKGPGNAYQSSHNQDTEVTRVNPAAPRSKDHSRHGIRSAGRQKHPTDRKGGR